MTGLNNVAVGILPQGNNTSVKVASSSRTAGHSHGHGHKGGGFIPPHNNPQPKGVAPSMSGRIGHSTPQNDVGSPDQDDCALSV